MYHNTKVAGDLELIIFMYGHTILQMLDDTLINCIHIWLFMFDNKNVAGNLDKITFMYGYTNVAGDLEKCQSCIVTQMLLVTFINYIHIWLFMYDNTNVAGDLDLEKMPFMYGYTILTTCGCNSQS